MQPSDSKAPNPHILYMDFVDLNGGDPVQVMKYDAHNHSWTGTREWLLPSGARVVNDGGPNSPLLHPAPANAVACLIAQRRYWHERLEQVQRECRSLALALKGYGEGYRWDAARYGPAHRTGEAALLHLQALSTTAQTNLAKVVAYLRATPAGQHALEQAEQREQPQPL
jgi:hypothetical protein